MRDWLWPKLQAAYDWFTGTAWPKIQEVMGNVQKFIETDVIPAFEKVRDWLWPKMQAAYDWWNGAWPQIQQAMSDVAAFIEKEVVPKLAAIYDWLWPHVEAAFTWATETAWPAVKTAMKTVIDYINNDAIPALQGTGKAVGEAAGTPEVQSILAGTWASLADGMNKLGDAAHHFSNGLKNLWLVWQEIFPSGGESGALRLTLVSIIISMGALLISEFMARRVDERISA